MPQPVFFCDEPPAPHCALTDVVSPPTHPSVFCFPPQSNPNYGAALDTAGTYLNKVQETTLYNKLYEALGPYAEPYASRLASSTYVTATVDYFKPAPSLEGINTK